MIDLEDRFEKDVVFRRSLVTTGDPERKPPERFILNDGKYMRYLFLNILIY